MFARDKKLAIMNQQKFLEGRSTSRMKYQKYMTNQEVINTVLSNPKIFGDPKDGSSKATKMFQELIDNYEKRKLL